MVDALGRIGLVGYGVVHLLVAWLALQVAFGVPDLAPDAQGAVGTIADRPGGAAVLGVIVVGLVAFVLWQLTAAAIGFRWVRGGERVRKRIGAVSKSIAISGLAATIVGYLGERRAGSATTANEVAAGLDVALRALGSTALGSSLLVSVAAGFAAFGLFCFADAATRRA